MTNPHLVSTGSFDELIATRMLAEGTALAARWLERLTALLPQDTHDVFPGDHLLDHIPAIVTEIAKYILVPESDDIAANTAVIEKRGNLACSDMDSTHRFINYYENMSCWRTSSRPFSPRKHPK
jgi:hypothetical protein